MAIVTTTVNRRYAVSDLFDSFHNAHDASSKLKDKKYPEESIFQFVQLTGNDDFDARAAVLKDLGFSDPQIESADEQLAEGKILICVDFLEESDCARVGEILKTAGGLALEDYLSRVRTPVKKPAVKRARKPRAKKAAKPDKAPSA
jgi:hypothetical protein